MGAGRDDVRRRRRGSNALALALALAAGGVSAEAPPPAPCTFDPFEHRISGPGGPGFDYFPEPYANGFVAGYFWDVDDNGWVLLHSCTGHGYMLAAAGPVGVQQLHLRFFTMLESPRSYTMRQIAQNLAEEYGAEAYIGDEEIGRCDCDVAEEMR
ncbi:hypothetical protein [Pseudoroseicyclus sp. CXY001]|uniref:hypothetical protein n=1 Tax=Pseudoroseicyclus sp. CXY001 TaxID=3242492 RepID=UPI00358DD830